jgi:glycosyltransferase involved in cell wall biosynthesis
VLFVDPVGEKGGAEVVLLDLVRGLDRRRFTPLVACLGTGPFVEELKADGVATFALPPHRVRQPHRVARTIRSLSEIIRREQVDVVHANSGHLLFYARLAARASGAAVVWHPHDPLRHSGLFERLFVGLQRSMRPDWTVFANPAVAASYLAAYPRIRRHDVVVPGVDPARVAGGDARRARAELGIPGDAPIVSMFARLQSHKGHLDLLDAASRVRGIHPSTRFVLCGGTLFGRQPEYAERVASRVSELAFDGRVLLPGHVSETLKRDLLAASSIVAHPATHEPFGIAVLEAMAAGKAVVAADADGPSHTVVHGATGLLVPAGDADALGNAIEKLLDTPDLADAMGRAGRARVEQRFSVEAMVRAVEAVYEQVAPASLGRPVAPTPPPAR